MPPIVLVPNIETCSGLRCVPLPSYLRARLNSPFIFRCVAVDFCSCTISVFPEMYVALKVQAARRLFSKWLFSFIKKRTTRHRAAKKDKDVLGFARILGTGVDTVPFKKNARL